MPPELAIVLTVIFSVSPNHELRNDCISAPNVPAENNYAINCQRIVPLRWLHKDSWPLLQSHAAVHKVCEVLVVEDVDLGQDVYLPNQNDLDIAFEGG